jgi:hypothetical protein
VADKNLLLAADLCSSLLLFTCTFYKLRMHRPFTISHPTSRESHYITIAKALTKAHDHMIDRLMINVPPRYGKSEMLIHFVAWCMALNPDCNFLYISYSHDLAMLQTKQIREIMMMPEYKRLFGVEIKRDSSAKDNFSTTAGGTVYAAGLNGTITGHGAGIKHCNRFGGCIIIDDSIKPDQAFSDTIRESANQRYKNTVVNRVNDPQSTPIIYIGQRTHEDDLPANLIKGFDSREWYKVILAARDVAGNALCPSMHTVEMLNRMEQDSPYEFCSQYQQEPSPAGGGIFQKEWFVRLDKEPEILATFMVLDTAETEKTYNDATAMSFFGIYKIKSLEHDMGMYGLHWIDCTESFLRPEQLKDAFIEFWQECMLYPVKPKMVAIEKASTGTSLIPVVKELRGLQVRSIEVKGQGQSKIDRFIASQTYAAQYLVSFPAKGKHTEFVIEHMGKVTGDKTHKRDDICDTYAHACKMVYKDKIIDSLIGESSQDLMLAKLASASLAQQNARSAIWQTKRY